MRVQKDAYYFPHDCNAKDDPKCVLLIEQLGLEGYGIFWVLVETLREQPDFRYPIKLIPALARRYNTTAEKMKAVVFSYGLFIVRDDRFFFSESLNRRMQIYLDKKKALSEAGKKGNQIRWHNKKITE
ncbi:Lin1244/Lin1753 domain-containing protein [Dysgonomonas massiliensis]|uniref:Lin1244/Lin1753 domain-containing protein n=1 Tax=Dysgonomonas massiliensis TaxID=2040292 RepID=UPI000C76116C|nr:Lin1244/Lin1753 domain-containing protein [Dysgonomonas massiliensis]